MDSAYQIITYAGQQLPEQYRAMVYSKWLRSLRFGNDYFKLMDSVTYYKAYHAHIYRVLNQVGCEVRLAVLPSDKDVVLGFSVARRHTHSGLANILDYVHVQRDYRKNGIGFSLISSHIDTITHLTRRGISFWTSAVPQAKFNPFI